MAARAQRKQKKTAPGVYVRDGVYRIQVRGARLPSGRLDLSLRTGDIREANDRAAAVRWLVVREEWDALANWKRGELSIGDIERAHTSGDPDKLKRLNVGSLTLAEECDRLLTTVAATREKGTLENYEWTARCLIEFFGADRPMMDITIAECEAFLHAPRPNGEPWGASSQNGHFTRAQRLWNAAIAREIEAADIAGTRPRLTRNPWSRVEVARMRGRREAFLSADQLATLIERNRGYPECAVVALGALAGLRIQECAHLRTGIDIDMDARRIHIVPRTTGEYPWRPKTEHSIRHLPIPSALHDVLSAHIGTFSGAYLIATPRGKARPLIRHTLAAYCSAAFGRAGIVYGHGRGMTHHHLRHTFATHLLLAKVPVHVVAKLMGDTVQTVLTTYAHLLTPDLEDGMAAMDAVVSAGRVIA